MLIGIPPFGATSVAGSTETLRGERAIPYGTALGRLRKLLARKVAGASLLVISVFAGRGAG